MSRVETAASLKAQLVTAHATIHALKQENARLQRHLYETSNVMFENNKARLALEPEGRDNEAEDPQDGLMIEGEWVEFPLVPKTINSQ